jgi:hypothetical protein
MDWQVSPIDGTPGAGARAVLRGLLIVLLALLICQPAISAAATAGPELTFSIGDDVSPEDEVMVREGALLARDYVAATLSPLRSEEIIINVRNSRDTTGGHAAAFSGGDYIVVFTRSAGWRSIAPFDRIHVVVHEYIHSWQASLAGDEGSRAPLWLIEGTAEYLAYDAVAQEGFVREREVTDAHAWSVLDAPEMSELQDLEGRDAFYGEPGPVYSLAYLAVADLVGDGSPADIDRFFELMGSGEPWPDAFATAFGQDVDAFYSSFARARQDLIGPRNQPDPFTNVDGTHSESPVVLNALPEDVAAGEQVTILAQSDPGATCSLRLRSADSGERLNRTTVTDGAGRLFWLVTIPAEFAAGPVDLAATCGGATVHRDLTIERAP